MTARTSTARPTIRTRSRGRPPRRPLLSLGRAVSWHRRKLAVLAALATVLTGLAAAAPEGPPTLSVVRVTHEVPGGTRLAAADLELARVVADDAPRGALTELAGAVDHLLAAPVAEGQIITPAALTTARAGTSRGRVMAPLRLADADLVELLRPGDHVDVIAADPQSDQADVVARSVRVVTVPRASEPAQSSEAAAGRLILIEVDPETARVLARAGVSATLTVIWR
jgi:Flp pilus assembly protein CpaB